MDHFSYAATAAREREIIRVVNEQTPYASDSTDNSTLEKKVAELERHHDFLVDVVNALLDDVYGPDDEDKPQSILKVVRGFK